jgi:DNA invertase Pin-like site-specific DNA recombinase
VERISGRSLRPTGTSFDRMGSREMAMKLAAYLRVSTDKQAEEGLGLEVQEQAIKRWAKRNGHRVVLWTRDEGVSGSNGPDTRLGLQDALNALRHREAEGLITYNLDRLARTLHYQEAILGQVWAMGGTMFTVEDGEVLEDDPDDPMRTAMRQMRGVFSQLEAAMIRKRMKEGRRAKAAKGGYAHGAPQFGKRAEGRSLVDDPDEQKAIELVARLHAENKSFREIAAALTAEGHKPKRSATWHPMMVRRIVQRLDD